MKQVEDPTAVSGTRDRLSVQDYTLNWIMKFQFYP